MTRDDIIKMALEALEDANDVARMEFSDENYYSEAINALRKALETEQKPVAWTSSLDFDDDDQEIIPAKDKGKLGTGNCDIPLYTAPSKQWVGLTEREVELIDEMIETQLLHAERCDHMANSTMAQKQKAWDLERVELLRKLKEKNT
jgi:hypothetical protein